MEPVTQWVQDLQDPTQFQEAARKLWERYHRYLEWLIANRIAPHLQGKFSEESVVQETFFVFFQGQQKGEFKVPKRRALVSLLAKIAHRKVVSDVRHYEAQKRQGPQHSPYDFRGGNLGDLEKGKKIVQPQPLKRKRRVSHPVDPHAKDESSPSGAPLDVLLLEAVDAGVRLTALEHVETLDADLRAVLDLYAQGYTDDEIAGRLDIERGAVRRKLKIIEVSFREVFTGRDCD